MTIKKLMVANRGEIAVRIHRAAHELGMNTVQVHSRADKDSLAVAIADEAVDIGPPQAARSYLNIEAILQAAHDTGVDAIHPGYGFLSENSAFAHAVEQANLIFVGPTAATIKLMGDKVNGRIEADKAGVSTIPGSDGRIDSIVEAKTLAQSIGFPLVIKAAAGGGGRGIRVVDSLEEFDAQAPLAQAEAQAAFGDGGLYLEKFINSGRHIEVQVLGDGYNVIHLYERECSLQRRRQKVWEEAPAIDLNQDIRDQMCQAAVALAQSVRYRGAGTVEFLYSPADSAFYFMEMNTRIQVEHPVTEMITGVDIVREMIRIARGEKLRLQQEEIRSFGHAIEVRLNAEDPFKDFMPFPGLIKNLRIPGGPGIRFDHMLFPGYTIPPFYDSLLGKLIVWDETRSCALTRMKRALDELSIEGISTTQPLFKALCDNTDIQQGCFDTRWLEHWLPHFVHSQHLHGETTS